MLTKQRTTPDWASRLKSPIVRHLSKAAWPNLKLLLAWELVEGRVPVLSRTAPKGDTPIVAIGENLYLPSATIAIFADRRDQRMESPSVPASIKGEILWR